MRKLSWACDQAAIHHAAAACAITEAGVSKRHVNETGYRREVNIEDSGQLRGHAEYWVELDPDTNVVRVKTFAADCITRWRFSYPDLKLLTFHLDTCRCLSYDL